MIGRLLESVGFGLYSALAAFAIWGMIGSQLCKAGLFSIATFLIITGCLVLVTFIAASVWEWRNC
jgi:hypothetical protein